MIGDCPSHPPSAYGLRSKQYTWPPVHPVDVKEQNRCRLAEIDERLDHIDAHEAEQKATMILIGLGFTEENI